MNNHDASHAAGQPRSPIPNEKGAAMDRSFEEFDRSIRRVVRRAIRQGRAISPTADGILAIAEQIAREAPETPLLDKRRLTSLVSRRILDSLGPDIARRALPGDDLFATIARHGAASASSTLA